MKDWNQRCAIALVVCAFAGSPATAQNIKEEREASEVSWDITHPGWRNSTAVGRSSSAGRSSSGSLASGSNRSLGIELNNRGIELFEGGQDLEALQSFMEASRRLPNDAMIQWNVGSTMMRVDPDRYSSARLRLERALMLDPGQSSAGGYAVDGLEAIRLLETRHEAYRAVTRGDAQGTIRHFQETLRANPQDPDARLEIAFAFMQLGQWERAETLLVEQLRHHPDNFIARTHLRTVRKRLGKFAPLPPPPVPRAALPSPYSAPAYALRLNDSRFVQALREKFKTELELYAEGELELLRDRLLEEVVSRIPGVRRARELMEIPRFGSELGESYEETGFLAFAAADEVAELMVEEGTSDPTTTMAYGLTEERAEATHEVVKEALDRMAPKRQSWTASEWNPPASEERPPSSSTTQRFVPASDRAREER